MLEHRLKLFPDDSVQTRTQADLQAYVRGRASILHHVDLWISPALRTREHGPSRTATRTLGLRPGDVISYNLLGYLITHDIIYVGKGYFVSLVLRKNALVARTCEIKLVHYEHLKSPAGQTLHAQDHCSNTVLPRLTVVTRALDCIGIYPYHILTNTCEHSTQLLLGNLPYAHYHESLFRVVFFVVLISLLISKFKWK